MKRKQILSTVFALITIILAQTIYTVIVFNSKQSFHTDELWTYGLSNSYYRPFLFMEPDMLLSEYDEEDTANAGEWLDGSFYGDYLTVNEGERFSYDSVVFNQTKDMHPPLYYSILHTICSFFPGQFSWYFAFSLSIVCLCITQVFLFLLTYEITKKRTVSLLACFLYACSMAALFTFTFIRQYSMLAMWCTIITYVAARFFNSDFNLKKYLLPMAMLLFLAAMTQFLIIVYIGALTFFICLYLLVKKRIRTMLIFGLTMAATLGAYILIWPYCISSTANYEISHIFTYPAEVKLYLEKIIENTFGIKSLISNHLMIGPVIVFILMLFVPIVVLSFLFRNETWFCSLKMKCKSVMLRMKEGLKQINIFAVIVLASCMAEILVAAKVSSVVVMGRYSLRYVAFFAPCFVSAVVYIIYGACRCFLQNRRWAAVATGAAVVACSILTNIVADREIVLTETPMTHESVINMIEDQTVVMSISKIPLLQGFPEYFMHADKVYFDKSLNILENTAWLEEARKTDKFYMMLTGNDVMWEKDMEAYIEESLVIPKNTDKEMLKEMGVQFYDDFINFFENQDFVQSTRIAGTTKNNDFDTVFIEVITKE